MSAIEITTLILWTISIPLCLITYKRSKIYELPMGKRRVALSISILSGTITLTPIFAIFAFGVWSACAEPNMVWLLFQIYVFFGLLGWICRWLSRHYAVPNLIGSTLIYVFFVFLGISGLAAGILLLAGLGWVWYYLAGGFLIIKVADSFFEFVFYGLLSAFGILFLIGAIVAAFKH